MADRPVNTARTSDRRTLRFESLSDLRAELDRLETADRAGRIRLSGNWSAGQILGHLASWMSYPYEGFPLPRAPWFVRAIIGLRRERYFRVGLPRGVRIPGVPGGTVGIDDMPFETAAARFRAAIDRLERDAHPPHPSPVFGVMSHDDWIRLNLRHAELHLGFVHPDG